MDNYEHLDRAWEELTPEEKKQIFNMKEGKTIMIGVGHQYRKDEKTLHSCGRSLVEAYNNLNEIINPDIDILRAEILQLINKITWLSYSAREKSKINQD